MIYGMYALLTIIRYVTCCDAILSLCLSHLIANLIILRLQQIEGRVAILVFDTTR